MLGQYTHQMEQSSFSFHVTMHSRSPSCSVWI